MARKVFKPRGHDTGSIITTKTAFGSTSDMIVDITSYTLFDGQVISIKNNEVICKDDRGFYITTKDRLDTKLADPNRYANTKNRIDLLEKKHSSVDSSNTIQYNEHNTEIQ